MNSQLKTAIVYDRVNKWGGAERVLLTLHEMFPEAPLYTSVYDEKNAEWAKVFPKIYTSFLQKFSFIKNKHELLGWIMPLVFEQFNFDEYDLVISVTSESAKGIITKPNTHHVCYCLTPTRYLWSGYNEYFQNKLLMFLTKPIINYLKSWDRIAGNRPDKIIAISTEVQKRIKKYYDRDSEIIFPPSSNLDRKNSFLRVSSKTSHSFLLNPDSKYFLVVSRLVKYKKVDIAIKVFNKLNLPLVIVGVGSGEKYLKSIANKNIKFVGKVSDEELFSYYKQAKALIMSQDEDFGIVAVEAQSFGIPVIAYKSGGAIDTVIDERSGIFFDKQTEESLTLAVEKFGKMKFNKVELQNNAKRFSKSEFERQLQRSLVCINPSWWGRNTPLAKIKK